MSDKTITNLVKRIAALEEVVHGTAERLDRRLNIGQVAEREGVTTRTIARRLANPDSGFPKPERINQRYYWWLTALEQYDAAARHFAVNFADLKRRREDIARARTARTIRP